MKATGCRNRHPRLRYRVPPRGLLLYRPGFLLIEVVAGFDINKPAACKAAQRAHAGGADGRDAG